MQFLTCCCKTELVLLLSNSLRTFPSVCGYIQGDNAATDRADREEENWSHSAARFLYFQDKITKFFTWRGPERVSRTCPQLWVEQTSTLQVWKSCKVLLAVKPITRYAHASKFFARSSSRSPPSNSSKNHAAWFFRLYIM